MHRKGDILMKMHQITKFFKRLFLVFEILFLTLKDIIVVLTFPIVYLIRKVLNYLVGEDDTKWINSRLKELQQDINRLDIDRLNNKDWYTNNQNITGHKHDNYQSQIDSIYKTTSFMKEQIDGLIQSTYKHKGDIRELENSAKVLVECVKAGKSCEKDINELQLSIESISDKLNSHIDIVEARQVEDRHLDMLYGEAKYYDVVNEYIQPEPNFKRESELREKQIQERMILDEEEFQNNKGD